MAPHASRFAEIFYRRLFDLDPTLRNLFKNDMQEQGRKLMEMMNIAINGLPCLETLRPDFEALGRRHLEFNVTADMYDAVGEALLWTLEQALGEAFTPEVEAAWAKTYGTLADVMKSAAYEPVSG